MTSPERYLDVPFLPGESPFHCKGILYVDSIAYYDEHVPGGWAGLTDRIRNPRLKSYLSQRFLAGALASHLDATWLDTITELTLVADSFEDEPLKVVPRLQERVAHGEVTLVLRSRAEQDDIEPASTPSGCSTVSTHGRSPKRALAA